MLKTKVFFFIESSRQFEIYNVEIIKISSICIALKQATEALLFSLQDKSGIKDYKLVLIIMF